MRSRLNVYGGMKPMTLRTIHSFGLRSPSSSSAAQRARCSSPAGSSSALDIQASPPIHPVLEAGPGPAHHALQVVALAVVAAQDRLDDELGRGDTELLGATATSLADRGSARASCRTRRRRSRRRGAASASPRPRGGRRGGRTPRDAGGSRRPTCTCDRRGRSPATTTAGRRRRASRRSSRRGRTAGGGRRSWRPCPTPCSPRPWPAARAPGGRAPASAPTSSGPVPAATTRP